ncbi:MULTISPECIES: hypothetical protein [Anoxybacillaceae]|nr:MULTISPECIES: hypothetical protein [Anoxybacillus]
MHAQSASDGLPIMAEKLGIKQGQLFFIGQATHLGLFIFSSECSR